MSKPRLVGLVGFAAASYASTVNAQSVSHDRHRPIEEVVVNAHPLGSTVEHIVQPIDVIDREQVLERGGASIGEVVGKEIGVTSSDFGRGVGRPIIRGQGGGRVRVLSDGIGTMDVSTVSPDHAVAAEPVFAEQIEIYRGPATLAYGSGASGGLVNIIDGRLPERLPEALRAELYAAYDSALDGWTGAFRADGALGAFALHLDGLLRDSDDYDIPGFAEREPDGPDERPGRLDNSATEAESIAGGATWIGSRGTLGFVVSRLDNDYGVPGVHHHDEGGGPEPEEEGGVRIAQDSTRVDLKAALDEPLAGIERLRARVGHNDHEHREIELGGEVGTLLLNDEWEGRIEVLHHPLARWEGAIGLQYVNRDFESTGEEAFVPDSTLESFGVFVIEKRDWDALHLEFGARYEHQNTKSTLGDDAEHEVWSLSGGLAWQFATGHEVGVAVTRAERAPSIEELYAIGPHLATNTFEIGDPRLDAETSHNVDVSLSRIETPWTWTLNLFYNRIAAFVFESESDLNGDGIADRVEEDFDGDPANILPPDETEEPLLVSFEQDDAEFYGVEFETELQLIDDARGRLDIRAWADYVRARRIGGGNLPRIPAWRVGSALTWSRGPVSAGIDYTHVADQDRNASLETATEGHELLELHAAYTLNVAGARWSVFARGTNLLDEEIRRHTSFLKDVAPLPGRSALVGMRIQF